MKPTAMLILLLVALLFAGCTRAAAQDAVTEQPVRTAGSSLESSRLRGDGIELLAAPDAPDGQATTAFLITNSKQIAVFAENIPASAAVEVFLYSAVGGAKPIAEATIRSGRESVVFDNLTSAAAYRVGATVQGTSDTITLTISE